MAAFKHNYTSLYYKLYNALNYAVDKGCVVVCAAGNDTLNTERHSTIPASFSSLIPGVISVAAVGNTGDITQYSNYSESVTIAAPVVMKDPVTDPGWCRLCINTAHTIPIWLAPVWLHHLLLELLH